MILNPETLVRAFAQLVRAFAQFMDSIGVKTSSGRMMLGFEFSGLLFLLALGFLAIGHETVELVLSFIRRQQYVSRVHIYFIIFAAVTVASMVVVFVREMVGGGGDSSS